LPRFDMGLVSATGGEGFPHGSVFGPHDRCAMLTDTQVGQAHPKDKEYKLSEERGLLLVVRPNGAKWWRLRYRFQGPEKMISLGTYPDVTLSMARGRRAP